MGRFSKARRVDFLDVDSVRLERASRCHTIVRANPRAEGIQLWVFGRDGNNNLWRRSTRVSLSAEAAFGLIDTLRDALHDDIMAGDSWTETKGSSSSTSIGSSSPTDE